MRKLLVIFFLISAGSCAQAATGAAVTKAFADTNGSVHILSADGGEHIIKPWDWQAGGGFENVDVAPDGKTVGWLASQMLQPLEGGTNYEYAVALELDIWRDGRVIRKIPAPGLVIQNWTFLKDGNEVAFHIAPTHGQEFYECFLFDVNTGRRLQSWSLDRKNYVVPEWAKPLLVNDPLPEADEIANWLANAPPPQKPKPKSKQR